jgi:hypothetical protein
MAADMQVLAMGTKSIPGFTGDLGISWDTSAAQASSSGPDTSSSGEVHMDVHMGEESTRGERDDD